MSEKIIIGGMAFVLACAAIIILVLVPLSIYRDVHFYSACNAAHGEVQSFKGGRICWTPDGRRIKI